MRPAMYIYVVVGDLGDYCTCVCVCVCVCVYTSGSPALRIDAAHRLLYRCGLGFEEIVCDSSDGSRRISATAFLSPLPWLWLCKILRPGSTAGSLIPRCRGFVTNTRCTAKPIATLCIKALLTRESRFDLNWLSAWGRSHRRCSTWPRAAPAAGAAPAGCSWEGAGRPAVVLVHVPLVKGLRSTD